MKKLLICLALGASLSAGATELKCDALLTSQGLLNSESAFKSEISEIVSSSVPSLYDELKVKVGWGEKNIISSLIIKTTDLATHQSLPRLPDPSAWPDSKTFNFTVAILGISKKAVGSSLKRYKIVDYPSDGKTRYTMYVDESSEAKVNLLNLYAALSIAPFVEVVIFEQELLPTKMSYPQEPVPLAEPEELRAIRNLRLSGRDLKKREAAVSEIKPGIVKILEAGKQLEYRGVLATGFSEDSSVVDGSKAALFGLEYVFRVPPNRRP